MPVIRQVTRSVIKQVIKPVIKPGFRPVLRPAYTKTLVIRLGRKPQLCKLPNKNMLFPISIRKEGRVGTNIKMS